MIDARVKKFNTDEWRRKYMTFEYMLKERERKGIEQGRSEGLAEGAAQKQCEIAKSKIYPIKWTQQEEGFLENGHKKKG